MRAHGNTKSIGKGKYTKKLKKKNLQNTSILASLLVQWLRICLPMQALTVQPLVQEDTTCLGHYAHMPQLLSPGASAH